MGLSASQARLLTITSRKSDCEFQSMRLSHEKLSISRDLEMLSNQYQNSLQQTKLVYDFYGTGNNMEQLNYALLMSPSALNDYRPITITNSQHRVILDSKYADAARIAGIPQEGLGCVPSTAVREQFVEGMLSSGIINQVTADAILSTPYNQAAGLGNDGMSTEVTKTLTLEDINKLIRQNCNTAYVPKSNYQASFGQSDEGDGECPIQVSAFTSPSANNNQVNNRTDGTTGGAYETMTLANLLNLRSDQQYFIGAGSVRSEQSPITAVGMMQKYLTDEGGFLDWLTGQFMSVLGVSDKAIAGVNYAATKVEQLLTCDNGIGRTAYDKGSFVNNSGGTEDTAIEDWWTDRDENTEYKRPEISGSLDPVGTRIDGKDKNKREHEEFDTLANTNHIGFVFTAGNKGKDNDGNDHSTAAINLNNIAKTFLTYFANYMNGLATDEDSKPTYDVHKGNVFESELVTNDPDFSFDFTETVKFDTESTRIVAFYDTLLNQICKYGWSENDEVNDKSYLQEMLQNGMMYISTICDDNFYYQKNYATWSYVKEVSDETAIAVAEAKYKTQKEKLNMKEQTIDLKMKNLDTEITSLTTEYDTVKNLISKNIEKGFKRYNA